MIYKTCSRCGKRLPSGTKCACLKQRHKEYDKHGRDKKSATFYHSTSWSLVRGFVMDVFSNCDAYELATTGRVTKADVVHHIEELKESPEKSLSPDNLIPVSSSTHNMIHAAYDRSPEDKAAMQKLLRECLEKAKNML